MTFDKAHPSKKDQEIKENVDFTMDKASSGGADGYNALMSSVNGAEMTYRKDPEALKSYQAKVAEGLQESGQLSQYAEIWAKQNFDRLNQGSGDKILSRGEVSKDNARNPLEEAFLKDLSSRYESLQSNRGPFGIAGKAGAIREEDLENVIEKRSKGRDVEQVKSHTADRETASNSDLQRLTSNMLSNDGDPSHSLFAKLAAVDGSKPDDTFDRKAIKRYLNVAETSKGQPGFSEQDVRTAQEMYNNWDGPAMKLMRGERANSQRGNSNEPEYNHTVDLSRLAKNLGTNSDAIFAANSPEGRAASVRQARANEQTVRSQGADLRQDQAAVAAPPGSGVGEVRQGGRSRAQANAGGERPPMRPVTEGDRANAQGPTGQGVAEVRRGRPVPRADANGNPNEGPAAGADRQAAPQRQEAAAAKPKVQEAPPAEVKMPEFKADADADTLAKTKAAYAEELTKSYGERQFRTVQDGDGWDRLARRELRAMGADTSEANVVAYSDDMAKMNGWNGRLDQDKMLYRDQGKVKVHTDEWVQDQIKTKLAEFLSLIHI